MKLYIDRRSTNAYRVCIALRLKGLDFKSHIMDLVAGEQRTAHGLKLLTDMEQRCVSPTAFDSAESEHQPDAQRLP